MMSGYTHCACRDCMDVTVSTDTSKPELCTECKEAGCNVYPAGVAEREAEWRRNPVSLECQRGDTYES